MFENLPQTEWARLAAYIDGEGSIMILTRGGSRAHSRYLRVNLCNTDPRLLVWLRDTFGGSLTKEARHTITGGRHRNVFRWHISCAQAAEILRYCLPYFIIKREQAEVALAFQSTLRGPGSRQTSSELQHREGLVVELSRLKHENAGGEVFENFDCPASSDMLQ